MSETPIQYLTEKQASEHLGMAVKTMQRWRWQGFGPPYCRFGRSVRYPLRSLDEWAAAQLCQSTSDPGPAPQA